MVFLDLKLLGDKWKNILLKKKKMLSWQRLKKDKNLFTDDILIFYVERLHLNVLFF